MQITKLYKAIAETGATHFQTQDGDLLSIDSKEYQERKDYFIKGGYTIEDDYIRSRKILRCAKIEKDVTITINRPVVNGEKLPEVKEKALCQLCGEPMPEGEEMFNYHGYSGDCPKPPKEIEQVSSFVVFHKPTGQYTGRDLKRKDVPAWSESVIKSFEETFKKVPDRSEFTLVVVDWEKKNISFESFE